MKPCGLGVSPLIVSEGRHYTNRWLDWRSSITFDPNLRIHTSPVGMLFVEEICYPSPAINDKIR